MEKLCACGCGRPVTKPKNKFILGHSGKLNKGRKFTLEHRMNISKSHREKKIYPITCCECGCGQIPKRRGSRFVSGHNLRIKHHMNNPAIAKKVGLSYVYLGNTYFDEDVCARKLIKDTI